MSQGPTVSQESDPTSRARRAADATTATAATSTSRRRRSEMTTMASTIQGLSVMARRPSAASPVGNEPFTRWERIRLCPARRPRHGLMRRFRPMSVGSGRWRVNRFRAQERVPRRGSGRVSERSAKCLIGKWRPRPELNWCTRFCRPLRNHSATWPHGANFYRGSAGRATAFRRITRLRACTTAYGRIRNICFSFSRRRTSPRETAPAAIRSGCRWRRGARIAPVRAAGCLAGRRPSPR